MRGHSLGFLNEDPVITPHLDAFARESLVLPQAVSNYPVCSPFRAMLMSGKYPLANGVVENCNNQSAKHGVELKETERCWSDILKEQGYSLGYIGKWHLDAPHEPYIDCKNNEGALKWNEWCPPGRRHGFDYWYAYGTYDYHMNPMYWNGNAPRDGFHVVNQWGPEHEADKAIDYILNKGGHYRKAAQPFALVVSMNPPHSPYDQFPKKYLEPYKNKTDRDLIVRDNVDLSGQTDGSRLALKETKNYFANITGVDAQFGRILAALEQAGLSDNTVVVFTSDHGNCLGTHEEKSKNIPYEEAMRIPFLIRWPGKIAPRIDPLLLSAADIYPTLLELMGLGALIPREVQGNSHANLFLTGRGARPTSQLYLKTSSSTPKYGLRGVRTDRYKLVIDQPQKGARKVTLYDRANDATERNNIAENNPELIRRLVQEELIPWLKKTEDPWISFVK